jgi:lipoprotein-anchoring transpeptidase ErfK/SrfK
LLWNDDAVTSPRSLAVGAALILTGAACATFDAAAHDNGPDTAEVASPISTSKVFVGGPQIGETLDSSEEPDAAGDPASEPSAPPGPGAWVVRGKEATLTIWRDPGGDAVARFAVETSNPWEQSISFPIVNRRMARDGSTWYRVLLGVEPNGSNGWIRATDVSLDKATDRIVVDMSKRVLRHYHYGHLRHRFRIGIGKATTPTTPGRYFVWAHLDPSDASGPYGSYLLGLSGFSEVLTEWPGGGRLAIHGTDEGNDLGEAVSSGCVRVYNPQMERLRRVPLGTTVIIRR